MNETETTQQILTDRHEARRQQLRRRRIRTVVLILILTLLLVAAGFAVRKLVIDPYLSSPIVPEAALPSEPTAASEPEADPILPTPEEPETEPAEEEPSDPAEEVIPAEPRELDLEVYSAHAILLDVASGAVLSQKDPDAQIYPASMTKVMTLLVAAESLPNLDDTFTMTQAIIDPLFLADASMAGIVADETLTYRDILYAAVVPSGAEATEAIAQAVAGSEEGFVAKMNAKVSELGLTHTHFVNPSGLHDENQYTTVREMAVILHAAMDNPICRKVLEAESYVTDATAQHPSGLEMTNKFLFRIHNFHELGQATVDGAKTGYTAQAKSCCASFGTSATGHHVICVTAFAETADFCIEDHVALYTLYDEAIPAEE